MRFIDIFNDFFEFLDYIVMQNII